MPNDEIKIKVNKRLLSGEAWMWCHDCNSKLYSFDGIEDKSKSCPHPKKCKDENDILSRPLIY